ncbi:MAG: hypothetical protein U5L46_04690 [Agrobacterium sp.]|nr:hypothetical protein [Agrobacterium sp.]
MEMILEERVLKHLDSTLRAYFDYREGQQCANLRGFIAGLIRDVCQKLDVELLRKVAEKVDGKDLSEWRSWYIDEAVTMQANAVGAFAHRVIDVETLSTSALHQKVPCDLGYKHADEFVACWQETYGKRLAEKEKPPSSKNFQDKRKRHTEPPYLMKEILGLSWLQKRSK